MPETTLNQYLRNIVHLTGTKSMCLEGGCGACVVCVSFEDPLTHKNVIIAVNSVSIINTSKINIDSFKTNFSVWFLYFHVMVGVFIL